MNTEVERPDVNKILRSLKDFQRKSVNYVFRRLYKDSNKTNRFLIADEVGLGKTLVAKGVVAKSINYLWDIDVKRIDIIYVCANREIANQNVSRLKVMDKQFAVASRITLLPLKIENLKNNKLNFISFTPKTSFELRSKTGIMDERALLYYLLKKDWNLKGTGPMNLLQDQADKDNWRRFLKDFRDNSIDEELKSNFINALNKQIDREKANGEADIKKRFLELCFKFQFHGRGITDKDKTDARAIIGELRTILAQSCLDALEPDIVILDEFQRFKYLLDDKDEMGHLAYHLFNYKSKEVEDTKIILLSATPYKMYTLHHEEELENHYEDFLRTINFLFNDDKKTKRFEDKLIKFRNEFFYIKGKDFNHLKDIKEKIEKDLRRIMIRTERLAQTVDRNGMIEEKSKAFCRVELDELEIFSAIDKLSKELRSGDVIEYWKSAPYLLNLMDAYDLKRKFKRKAENEKIDENLFKIIKNHLKKTLRWRTIESYNEVSPANAKLKALISDTISRQSWKLLWIPPALPYYRPYGKPYNSLGDKELQKLTKSLIFSSWQVVPKAISIICSYEAERHMVTGYRQSEEKRYTEERTKRGPLIRFAKKEERPMGMGNLTLLYPCLTLATKIDPLEISLELVQNNEAPPYTQVKNAVKEKIKNLLKRTVKFPVRETGRYDDRWYWISLALLDRYFYKDDVESWLKTREKELKWDSVIKGRGKDESETLFKLHTDNFKDYFVEPPELGRMPNRLIDVLTKLAMASPAVVALRSLYRLRKRSRIDCLDQLLISAALIASGFRSLYNLPESITLIRSINEREPYWERVLDYGISGNLQAVMDEYVHILKESLGLFDQPIEKTVRAIGEEIFQSIALRTTTLDFDDIEIRPIRREIKLKNHSIRCRYALRFGEGKSEGDEEVTREGQVRSAFNSPFRPFILASTSIGQEGLDFHQYCHSIYHWNLPPNPVDLEQREGRIHRYKGHVIRKNIAKEFGLKKLREGHFKWDPWDYLFKEAVAKRPKDKDDIWPFWVFEPEEKGFKIERYIPCLPLSRDIERLKDLKRTLVAYRMVFGQPRQEDLIEFLKPLLDKKEIHEEIQNFRIDLSPR